MEGEIDSTFQTSRRDLFASGLVAEIGVNAFAVWSAIKFFADFNTGEAYPGMREIGEKIGLSKTTVQREVQVLMKAHLLRIVEKSKFRRKGQTYVARERLAVRLGGQIICYVVVDYVPMRLRKQINRIKQSLITGENDPDTWAAVEIVPGQGFVWDQVSGTLKSHIKASAIPCKIDELESDVHSQLGAAFLARFAPKLADKKSEKHICVMSHP